jgi:hypothetical protein
MEADKWPYTKAPAVAQEMSLVGARGDIFQLQRNRENENRL